MITGIFIHNDKVLLHRAEMDDFFTLSGGSVEFGESSVEAIVREMKEELNATVQVERLVWVAENFFEYWDKKCHEIGLYYKTHFTDEARKFYSLNKFDGVESEFVEGKKFKLHFEWVSLSDLKDYDVKPSFLKKALLDVPKNTEVRVNRDS